jgi:hypothetical protein
MRGDATLLIERAQHRQEGTCLPQCRFRWRGEEGQAVASAPLRKFQGEGGQVGDLDLGRRKGRARAILSPGPQPVASPRRRPSRATATLIGLRAADILGHKAAHATGRVEACAPCLAAIDDDPDASIVREVSAMDVASTSLRP